MENKQAAGAMVRMPLKSTPRSEQELRLLKNRLSRSGPALGIGKMLDTIVAVIS